MTGAERMRKLRAGRRALTRTVWAITLLCPLLHYFPVTRPVDQSYRLPSGPGSYPSVRGPGLDLRLRRWRSAAVIALLPSGFLPAPFQLWTGLHRCERPTRARTAPQSLHLAVSALSAILSTWRYTEWNG